MPGFELPSDGAIADVIKSYVNSDVGQQDMAAQGFGTYTREALQQIGQNFLADIEAAYRSVLTSSASTRNDGSSVLSTSVFRTMPEIKVSISDKNGIASILIYFPDDLLFRPSLEKYEWGHVNRMTEYKVGKRYKRTIESRRVRKGTGEYTGAGIKDIFALITHGYPRIRHAVSGLWDNNPRGPDRVTYALPQRTGTPFVPDVVEKYKALYPNVDIIYPAEWES